MLITHSELRKVKSLVSEICMQMGLNTACDYDGIETGEDIILYLGAIKKDLPIKSLADTYAVYREEEKDEFLLLKVCPHASSVFIRFLPGEEAEERKCRKCKEVFTKRLHISRILTG